MAFPTLHYLWTGDSNSEAGRQDYLRIIKNFPNSLNRMAYPRALYTSVQDGTRDLHVHAKKGDSSVAGRDIDVRVPSGPASFVDLD